MRIPIAKTEMDLLYDDKMVFLDQSGAIKTLVLVISVFEALIKENAALPLKNNRGGGGGGGGGGSLNQH